MPAQLHRHSRHSGAMILLHDDRTVTVLRPATSWAPYTRAWWNHPSRVLTETQVSALLSPVRNASPTMGVFRFKNKLYFCKGVNKGFKQIRSTTNVDDDVHDQEGK